MDEPADRVVEDIESGHSVASFANSDMFDRVYHQSMRLVREVADYLELEGVIDRKRSPEKLAPVFACESMRMTTRLMQVTAWLLALRAVKGGELTLEEYAARDYRLGSRTVCLGAPVRGAGLLPARLVELLGASRALYERVLRLDELLFGETAQAVDANPVNTHRNRIEQAFADAP